MRNAAERHRAVGQRNHQHGQADHPRRANQGTAKPRRWSRRSASRAPSKLLAPPTEMMMPSSTGGNVEFAYRE